MVIFFRLVRFHAPCGSPGLSSEAGYVLVVLAFLRIHGYAILSSADLKL